MTSLSIHASANPPEPRGAVWAADAAVALWRFVARRVGKPTAAALPAAEAAAVRELARQFMVSDPGFAADLFAAADRYEAQYETR